ncbi:MAG: trypsin-like peptidase domain-containing protein [Sulfuriferula multivorans]|uniref:Trypsin-like peptidase domain-containing protein n=1 Tax=Sulfuriferula multivorans TaxID=1559896 RepID=A0A7C9JWS8_9PROT|nr:trypsin-like peptidase domain-containing protein [Sulfuriferula multivorans]
MNKKSLLLSGLYRICGMLPGYSRPPSQRLVSKCHTHWAVIALVLSAPASADLADMVLNIKPGVVGVGTYNPTNNPRSSLQGTGFVVLDGRYVVSCAHIFSKLLDSEKNETHAVFLGHDRQMEVRTAKLIATDKARDLALLKITGNPLPALRLGDSTTAREGWQLYFTGYPIGSVLGLNPSTHRAGLAAIIPIFTPLQSTSQLTVRTLRQAQDPYEVFELDAIAYPGNSGSPVWNPDTGEVLGVVNSVYVKGAKEAALSAPSGISYAIPAKYVKQLLERALP